MNGTQQEGAVIRDLAHRVAEIAADPVQEWRRQAWRKLNSLQRVRPLIHIQALDPKHWEEMVPPASLQTQDPFLRGQELALRKFIYVWEHWCDDRVIDGVIASPIVLRNALHTWNWGIQASVTRPGEERGAYAFDQAIVEERDIDKIQTEACVEVDEPATEAHYQRLCELYDGILRVQKRGVDFMWFQPMDMFIRWRGIQTMFMDLMDRPAWVHEALERITLGYESYITQLERLGALSPGNGNTMLGSGGYAWTDELPQPDFDGTHVRLKDLWARSATQIFTDVVSADTHEEFGIRYEARLLERFGLSCYGCCEPLHRKMDVVRKIKNLRRVSMSPWVDIDVAAEAVGRDYVYTHKPNPAMVSMERWHPDLARAELRAAFERTRDNVLEVNLQDIHNVRGEERRLAEWSRIARELAEEYA